MNKIVAPALAFCVLGALTAYREMQRPQAESLAVEAALRPLAPKPFKVEDVQTLRIAGPGKDAPDFVISRTGASTFEIDRPFRAPAAAGAVERLVKAVSNGEGEVRSGDASMLDTFHLSPAKRVTVTIEGQNGEVLAKIGIGRSSGRAGAFVTFVDDAEDRGAYAVTTDLRGALGLQQTLAGDAPPEEPTAKAFQDANFPPLAFDEVQKVELRTARHTSVFEKKGRIWLTQSGGPGGRIELKASAIDKLLGQFQGGLRTSGLTDPAQRADLGLDAPTHALTVTLGDGSTRTLLGAVTEKDGVKSYHVRLDVAQDPDVVYEVTSWEFGKIFPDGGTLYALEAPQVIEPRIGRLVIRNGTDTIELQRNTLDPDSRWEIVSPEWALATRQSAVKQVIALLGSVRPIDWVDTLRPDALADAERSVSFGLAGDPDEKLLRMAFDGEAPGGGRLALLHHLPDQVLVVDDSTVDRMTPGLFSLHEPKVLYGWDDRLVLTVQVERVGEDGARTPDYVLSTLGGDWKLHVGGPESAVDDAKVKDYVKRLLGASVDGVRAEPVTPVAYVTLKRQLGDPVTLGIGPDVDGQHTLVVGGQTFTTGATELAPAKEAFAPGAAPPPKDDGNDDGKDDSGDDGGDEEE